MMSIHEQRLDRPGDGDAGEDSGRTAAGAGTAAGDGDAGEDAAGGGRAVGQAEPEVSLGDLEALQGVVKFPVRIKCATLSWNTLSQALDHLESERVGASS